MATFGQVLKELMQRGFFYNPGCPFQMGEPVVIRLKVFIGDSRCIRDTFGLYIFQEQAASAADIRQM
jgi:hypothetical protein